MRNDNKALSSAGKTNYTLALLTRKQETVMMLQLVTKALIHDCVLTKVVFRVVVAVSGHQ